MRRPPIIIVALLIVLAIAHTGAWWWADGQIRSGFEAWEAGLRAQGWTVTSGEQTRSGWPFEAALDVADLHVQGGAADVPGGIDWGAERVALSVSPLSPHRLSIAFAGAQHLRLGAAPDVPYTADRLVATVPLDPDVVPHTVDLSGGNVRLGLPLPNPPASGITVALLAGHLAQQPDATKGEAALVLTASGEEISLPPPPPGRTWPFGSRIASTVIEAEITGPVPALADLTARATAWRDGGGQFDVRRFALGWGPLGLSATTTLTLDAQMQPTGSGMVHIVGEEAAVEALSASHTITANTATAVRSLLGLLARTPQGGGAPAVDLPLNLDNRTLSMGHFPIIRLAPLAWPPPR